MDIENEDIKLFYENLDKFIELTNTIHIDSYVLANSRGRGEDVLLWTYNELKKEEQEEQRLAKEICYSLLRLTQTGEKHKLIFIKPKSKEYKFLEQKENITNGRE